MTGVYTDNQPDFTWLQPYEEKIFTQYFIPYRELGVVKNATSDLLMNIETEDTKNAILKLFATSAQKGLRIVIKRQEDIIWENITDLTPEAVFTHTIKIYRLMKQRFIFIVQPASYYFHGRLNQLKSNQFLNLQNLHCLLQKYALQNSFT